MYLRKGLLQRLFLNHNFPCLLSRFSVWNNWLQQQRVKLAVLLEGGECSGKTALVQELARIAGRRLVVLNLHQDTLTTDLLGSWTATDKQLGLRRFLASARHCFSQILRCFVLLANPEQHLFQHDYVLPKLIPKIVEWLSLMRQQPQCAQRLQQLIQELSGQLSELATTIKNTLDLVVQGEVVRVGNLASSLGEEYRTCTSMEEGLSFTFVEGGLVEAIKSGDWVLLDNLNCARGDVIERLNSLFEINPTLNLFESGQEVVLSRQNGMHADFRLFATVNTDRKAPKLSAALRNRCIIVRLHSLDDNLSFDNVASHDLFHVMFSNCSHWVQSLREYYLLCFFEFMLQHWS